VSERLTVVLSPRARRDIIDVLAYTRDHQGVLKAREYAALTRDAIATIASKPQSGKSRDDIRPGVLAYHISQRGRAVAGFGFRDAMRTVDVGTQRG
jgi:plasmid stabilization system protein ParE